jgi:hypothetical protein
MKHMKTLRYSTFLVVAASAVFAVSCKSKEKLPSGEKEVSIPCSGPEYWTTNKVFRANSVGESMDLQTAKKKAMTNARNDLAQAIQTTVKTVTDNYVNSREMNNREQVEERFESLNREIVDQTLSGIKTICEKQAVTEAKAYKYYVAIELSADDLVKEYNERLSKDERLRIDYDYEKFKETFDKEMEKRANNN